jgi:hypothetical protein
MKTTLTVIAIALAATLVSVNAADADHKTLMGDDTTTQAQSPMSPPGPVQPPAVAPPPDSSLDLDLKMGLNGFRLGGRLFGRDGYAGGAWLKGQARPDGFTLDGRVEQNGRAHNFKMNVDVDEWLRRAMHWWLGAPVL